MSHCAYCLQGFNLPTVEKYEKLQKELEQKDAQISLKNAQIKELVEALEEYKEIPVSWHPDGEPTWIAREVLAKHREKKDPMICSKHNTRLLMDVGCIHCQAEHREKKDD